MYVRADLKWVSESILQMIQIQPEIMVLCLESNLQFLNLNVKINKTFF